MKHRRVIVVVSLAMVAVGLALTLAFTWRLRTLTSPPLQRGVVLQEATLDGASLFELQSVWTTDDERTVQLRDLGGHFRVLALMFTECSGTCPMLVKELQLLQQRMPDDVADRTRFLLVSIDAEHDTPAVLRQYRDRMRLDRKRWTLLRGNAENVRELAAVLGFNYDTSELEGFVHSNLVTLLDPHGAIVHQRSGAGGDLDVLTTIIEAKTAAGRR